MAAAVRVIVVACCHGSSEERVTTRDDTRPWEVARTYSVLANHRTKHRCGCNERDMAVWEAQG